MPVEVVKEKIVGAINEVEIGSPDRGGAAKVGGETTMPFLFEEGDMPHKPVVAFEVWDSEPADWPGHLKKPFGDYLKDPVKWAKFLVSDFKAKVLCVKLCAVHPDYGNKPASEVVPLLQTISREVNTPLVIIGSGDDEKDNAVLPAVSQALKGRNCLLGIATQNNHKTLAVTCLADGHSIIAESPIDVNIAKQVNILISDMGFDPKRIVMHPTTASLGYGMEYVYSIMERARLAAFIGDKMLSMPFILFVGQEVWRTKEAKEFGERQGINWEIATAVSMLQAGADILVMRHPEAANAVEKYIDMIYGGRGK